MTKLRKAVLAALAGVIVPSVMPAASEAGAGENSRFQSTVSGVNGSGPDRYVPPLVSNGSLCLLVDNQGCQFQRAYAGMTPGICWEGRRYGPPNDQLIPFGHFEQEVTVDGRPCEAPVRWTQKLDTKDAVVTCRNDYANGLTVESTVFTPLDHDLLVIRKRIFAAAPNARPVRFVFKYQLTPPGGENRPPKRAIITPEWDAAARSMNVRYQVDGHRLYQGVVSVFSDKQVTAAHEGPAVALTADIAPEPGRPAGK